MTKPKKSESVSLNETRMAAKKGAVKARKRAPAHLPAAGAVPRPARARAADATERRNDIRVLVADDNDLVREVIVKMLRSEPGIDVIGEARDGEEAVRQAHALHPDVVIMDLSMPKMNGIEATRKLRAELPELKVIGLSAYDRADDRTSAIRAVGAVDCVVKGSSGQELIAAIRAASAG